MEKLIVGPQGAVVPASDGTVVGMRVAPVVRMVWALPVSGVELVPAIATQKALALLGVPDGPPDSSATVGGRSGTYVSRMVWATRL